MLACPPPVLISATAGRDRLNQSVFVLLSLPWWFTCSASMPPAEMSGNAPPGEIACSTKLSTLVCAVVRPVQVESACPPPRSPAHSHSKPPYLTSSAMERSFSSLTATVPPPMIEPLRAMQVMVAPLPSCTTVPTGIATGTPAVVPAAAESHSVTHEVE